MSTLSPAELRKYDWRIPAFLERLSSGKFITTSNAEVKLSYTGDDLEEKLRNDSSLAVGKLTFIGDDGTEYRLRDLQKDAGFGGKGSALKHEERAISLLSQKIEIEKYNYSSDYIPVVVGDVCYEVISVASTPGTPKSDFHFIDVNGNEILWVSHKHGSTARCFQQWSGCSKKVEPNIFAHPETQNFYNYITAVEFKPALTIAKNIEDVMLHNFAIYGNEYGNMFGRNNVQLVVQGDPTLSSNTANVHFDISSFYTHVNGETLPEMYTPTFMATYRNDRNDFGIKNCRVGILPKSGRFISEWAQDNEDQQ